MTVAIPWWVLYLLPLLIGGYACWRIQGDGHGGMFDMRPLLGAPFLAGGLCLTIGLFVGKCVA